MIYKISDEDRCLGVIKVYNQYFFIYTLKDDFILDIDTYHNGNEILEEVSIRSLLKKPSIDNFIKENISYIQDKEKLLSDFIYIYNEQNTDFWDLKDFGLLPSVVIDFDSQELFQIDLEFIPSFEKYVPNDWKSYLTPNFLDFRGRNEYYERYSEVFYWIKGNKNYLEMLILRTK